ncbi:MAG: hypothetical protein NPIRA02_29460 [Nitrospirales bacterium]|nr:MAG: hypothetical protein NPIRA02_29460 [Nitrospirales bacterium]
MPFAGSQFPGIGISRMNRNWYDYITDEVTIPRSVGYSPLNYDPRPATFNLPTTMQIDADLDAMKTAFDGFNTYSYVEEFTPYLVQSAIAKGFRGILLGVFDPRQQWELEGVVDLVKQYRNDIALSICLGSEGLFSGIYTWADLGAAYTNVHRMLSPSERVPITTTEPVFYYTFLGYPDLSQPNFKGMHHFGDYLAPNIHPIFVFSDQPAQPSVNFTRDTAALYMNAGERSIYVKETGFPNNGTISMTTYTEAMQQDYWQKYRAPGLLIRKSSNPDIFCSYCSNFEAFDLEWKRIAVDGVEAHWGFLDANRQPYDAFTDLL